MTAIVEHDPLASATLQSVLGGDIVLLDSLDALLRHLDDYPDEDVVVLGPSVDITAGLHLAETMRLTRPSLGVVLVRRRVDTSILAEALRAGVREVVEERDLSGIHDAVRRALDISWAMRHSNGAVAEEPNGHRGTLITVFAAKGGCGKTTVATNLAALIADSGAGSVCLVDLDLAFGDVAITMQLLPQHTIDDAVAIGPALDHAAVRSLLTQHSSGVRALAAPLQPDAREHISADLVGRVLDLLLDDFDYVIVDTPPAFDDHVLQAFDHSDLLLLLATLDVPALKNLKLTLETLELLNYSKDRWRILLNRADSKVGLSVSDVEKALRIPISGQIPSSRDVPASINKGVPIVLDDPRHSVSQALRRFAEQHITVSTDDKGAGSRRRLRRKARI